MEIESIVLTFRLESGYDGRIKNKTDSLFLYLIGQNCGGGNSGAWEKVGGFVLARLILRWLLDIQRE